MNDNEEITVSISTGKLVGKIDKNIFNGHFYSFLGIPYAKPPLGHLRFKAPQPAEPWTGSRDATMEGSECFQRNSIFETLTGTEDCLNLNVFTPALQKYNKNCANLKSVMVWIHGGGFNSGSNSTNVYGPEFLLTEDVVLVTINYRTGVLGFLSLEDPNLEIPGNAGLKDMVMALQWVQENINVFSGDPNNVTIFGESAGGAAVHYLILSPMASGLFHKAILQSGCALNIWAKGKRCAVDIARVLELRTTDEKKILAVLQNLHVDKLYVASEKVPDDFIASAVRPYGPVIERHSDGAFISENPLDIIKSGRYNHVPIMMGFNTREGILLEIKQRPKPFQPLTNFELAIPNFINIQPGSDISKLVAKQIKFFYYGSEEPSKNNKDKFYLLQTDNFFVREVLRTTKFHAKMSSTPVFLYRMSLETSLNLFKTMYEIVEPGVCHGDDLAYLFKNLLTPEIETGSHENVGIKRFVKFWTSFAKYGDPNPKDTYSYINVKWKPVTKDTLNFLDIGKNLTTGRDPEADRMAFWDGILKINSISKL